MIAPLFFVEGLQPAAAFHISEKYGIRGANAYFAGTADSGAMAIGRGMRTVRRGEADLVLAGGYDDATGWWAMSKMDGLGVLSTRTDLGAEAFGPSTATAPARCSARAPPSCVLEEREHALARGARCYAEITGFGAGNDCVRPPSPQPARPRPGPRHRPRPHRCRTALPRRQLHRRARLRHPAGRRQRDRRPARRPRHGRQVRPDQQRQTADRSTSSAAPAH